MKINRQSTDLKKTEKFEQKEPERRVGQATASKFSSMMDKAEEGNFELKMKRLAEDILAQGEKLSKRIDVKELKLYKGMIAEFLNEIVNGAHKYTKTSKLDRRGRFKVFFTIKKINEELDALTTEVLNKEVDNIKVLKKIEDIRGMILDIAA